MEFKETLKALREGMGLTQQKMAELLEIPPRTIENWEAGSREPPKYVQKLIIEKLKRAVE